MDFGSSSISNSCSSSINVKYVLLVPLLQQYQYVLVKGQMGSALMGSLRIPCCFLTEGLFRYHSVNICQYLPILRSFFSNLSKFITSVATPLVLTPFVRNQGGLHGRQDHAPEGHSYVKQLWTTQTPDVILGYANLPYYIVCQ